MTRKKWTPNSEHSDQIIRSREKRKWQIALRRYVVDRNPSAYYAPFFGLDMDTLRTWLQCQVDTPIIWEDFSKQWQLDHILPVSYFDFNLEEEMRLCWNFTNISVIDINQQNKVDLLAAKQYFMQFYEATEFSVYKELVIKIETIEKTRPKDIHKLITFHNNNKAQIASLKDMDGYSFKKMNEGASLNDILEENRLIQSLNI